MPVPKRKLSRRRRDMRSANKFITPAIFVSCKNEACDNTMMPHVVCNKCGFYKGKLVPELNIKAASK